MTGRGAPSGRRRRAATFDRLRLGFDHFACCHESRRILPGQYRGTGPVLGDCNDYAVTKRHRLTADGWPARDVLLSEVVTVSGEHHLVVVRTSDGDLVLDNLTDRIVPWFHKPYRWVRIQMPENGVRSKARCLTRNRDNGGGAIADLT